MNRHAIPSDAGTYALILKSDRKQIITIGKRGRMTFLPAWYIYAGSAFGPGGLRARTNRHIKKNKKKRWHIDYLREKTTLRAIWYTTVPPKRECDWARQLRLLNTAVPVAGFGSSDCKCGSHLFCFTDRPDFHVFSQQLDIPVYLSLMSR